MLFIVIPDHAFLRYTMEALAGRSDVRIIVQPKPPRGARGTLLKLTELVFAHRLRCSRYLGASLVAALQDITPDDRVLFFAIQNLKELRHSTYSHKHL